MKITLSLATALLASVAISANAADKLTGNPIGTKRCYDYAKGEVSSTAANLFDGNLNTYFATVDRSYTWAGLDLGSAHVITRVGWAPRNDSQGPKRVVLGVIQGANSPDFLDAVPIYIITREGTIGKMDYADIDCSLGFRYVRYVGPAEARCELAELEFYGTAGAGDKSHMYQFTNIPTVSINTVDAREPFDKDTDIVGNATIIAQNKIDTDGSMTIRERGNFSRSFPKKPWRVKFDKKKQPLGAKAKAKKWTLINNYGDKSLIRNAIAFEMARRLRMEFVPFCQPVDVVLNGEYKGCYQFCDQVEVNPDRVNVEEMTADITSGDDLTGGYLVEVDAYASSEPAGEWFTTSTGLPVTIKSPDPGVTEQFNYIKNYMQKLEITLRGSNFTNATTGYRTMLDITSFLQHFIVGELAGNTDTYWSTYMYKRRLDPKMYVGPVWDFDLGFDNDNRTYPINNITTFLYDSGRASSATSMKSLVDRIIKYDTRTVVDLSRVWSFARNDYGLTADTICAFIDKLGAEVNESQKLNFMRWPIMQEFIHENPRVPANYQAEIDYLKNYVRARFKRLDPLMNYNPRLSSITAPTVDTIENLTVSGNCISLPEGIHYTIYTTDGRTMFTGEGISTPLPAGFYIVTTPTGGRSKIAIR